MGFNLIKKFFFFVFTSETLPITFHIYLLMLLMMKQQKKSTWKLERFTTSSTIMPSILKPHCMLSSHFSMLLWSLSSIKGLLFTNFEQCECTKRTSNVNWDAEREEKYFHFILTSITVEKKETEERKVFALSSTILFCGSCFFFLTVKGCP